MAKKKAPENLDVKPLAAALSPLELHAIDKIGRQAKKLRVRLSVGPAQLVDFTVRIRGAISVGANQPGGTCEQVAPVEIVLGFLLPMLKPPARQMALERVRAAFSFWLLGQGDAPKLSEQDEAISADFLRALTRNVNASGKHGNVTGAVACDLVERHE